MNDAYRDPADLVARERIRKRTSLLAAAAAVVVTIAWIWVIETLAARARTQGPLAEAYYWGYSVPPFLLSWLAAVVASAFPGRSWLRFCLVYAAVGIFTLVGPAKAVFEFSDRAREANERTSADAQTQGLLKEQVRLAQELSEQPPFSPAGLASEEALASNENRLGTLLEILAKAEEIEGRERTTAPAPTADSELRALARDNRREQAEAYRETRAALAILRTSWGRWAVVDQHVKFEAAEDETQFRKLYEKAASAEQSDRVADADQPKARGMRRIRMPRSAPLTPSTTA